MEFNKSQQLMKLSLDILMESNDMRSKLSSFMGSYAALVNSGVGGLLVKRQCGKTHFLTHILCESLNDDSEYGFVYLVVPGKVARNEIISDLIAKNIPEKVAKQRVLCYSDVIVNRKLKLNNTSDFLILMDELNLRDILDHLKWSTNHELDKIKIFSLSTGRH